MDLRKLPVNLAGGGDKVLAVYFLSHGKGRKHLLHVHVYRVVRNLRVIAFADFRFVPDDHAAINRKGRS
jgi:precorrin-4 methylase